ncbi:hypothetical protein RJ641_028302 [Dillenia turbinata]|uniref:C2H2-type domain-containing protein n=1 Tax=Dillenia turbinata TaxID=194707 RepID=A0AAN8W015_9MAGN
MFLSDNTKRLGQDMSTRPFECRTCNRRFSTFQALGGHRASHKRARISEDQRTRLRLAAMKPKMHECSICGLEFAMGQALGGHMRRHKDGINETTLPLLSSNTKGPKVLKRSNSSRRVMSLDLNLTPLENDLQLMFGKLAPKVDLSL